MLDSNVPALNDDSTLKDVIELEWINSPSDESCPITLDNHKKHKRSDSLAQQTSDNDDVLPGLKVSGK
jgi:hypothetical protein